MIPAKTSPSPHQTSSSRTFVFYMNNFCIFVTNCFTNGEKTGENQKFLMRASLVPKK